MLKIITIVLLPIVMLFAGCGSEDNSQKKIAITFSHSSEIWERYAQSLNKELNNSDVFNINFQFANTADEQVYQIDKMLEDEPDCLVVGAVDRTKLASSLEKAKEKNIPVIAYDRLILDTDAVSYYVSFDNDSVGEAMGVGIEYELKLRGETRSALTPDERQIMDENHLSYTEPTVQPVRSGPYNIEVIAGDPTDKNAEQYFNGAMKVLKPYMDQGILICRSGELDFQTVSTADWDPMNVKNRFRRIMQNYYSNGEPLHIVLCSNDDAAEAVREVLNEVNYQGPFPILSGQDAEQKAIQAIREGKQAFTIYKPPQDLASKTVRMIKAVVDGVEPDINDVKSSNNGKIVVPAYFCTPMIINKSNIDSVK